MKCKKCGGDKWITTYMPDGISGCARCPECFIEPVVNDARPSPGECATSVIALGRAITFFPKEQQTLEFIAMELRELVNNSDELHWLIRTACTVIAEWRGVAQLRGIFCEAGYSPRDGIRVSSGIKGFAVAASVQPERRYLEIEFQENKLRMELYAAEFKERGLLPSPEPLPAVKSIEDAIRPSKRCVARPLRKLESELAQTPRPLRTAEENKRLVDELHSALDAKRKGVL